MTIKAIETEEDYLRALSRIDELMEAEPNTPEGDELELLVTLVEQYEEKKFPIKEPTFKEGERGMWSKNEKAVARQAFKRAYERESAEILNKIKEIGG